MKLVVVHVGKEGGRVASISLKQANGIAAAPALETPCSLICTRGGAVPHLIPEVLERLGQAPPPLLQAPLSSQLSLQSVLEQFGRGYKLFAGIQGLLYSSVHDPMVATPSGYNDKRGIAVWPRAGKARLDAARFMDLQAAVRPDWLELLCDADTPPEASKKRQRKALDRSLELLDECLSLKDDHQELSGTCLLAPLVGGHVPEDRLRSARAAASRHVHGYVLEGLANGPDTSLLPSIEPVAKLVADSLSVVPADMPRVLHGPWRPLHVLRLVQRGVDLFDSSYPCLATDRGAALVFPLQPRDSAGDVTGQSRDESDVSGGRLAAYEIRLDERRYREDPSPLVRDCRCYTCSHHSRAYIHHLLMVKELLASVLLQLHNLHHWSGFFDSVRLALAAEGLDSLADTFQRLERCVGGDAAAEEAIPSPEDNPGRPSSVPMNGAV